MGKGEGISDLAMAYRLRWKRRRLLWRSFRKRHQLRCVRDNTARITPDDVLCFSTVRNEALRLPYFLDHHRRLGVRHFLMVENASDDGTREYLAAQADISLWTTQQSYKLSRFGVDWLTVLQMRYGHGHWCLTLDADECLIYPYHDTRPLPALCTWLEDQNLRSFGTLMLDMYPQGRLSEYRYEARLDPFQALCWFDSGNYAIRRKLDLQNLWIQGGPRARMFFADDPRRAPTMGKVPLVKWNRRYAYVSSAHSLLPRHLNHVYDSVGGEMTSGILLHSKFMNTVVERAVEEKQRQEHFANSSLYTGYYDALRGDPDLWCEGSTRFTGWRQLEAMGLMSRGGWI